MSDEVHDPRSSFFAASAVLWLLGFAFALMPLEAYEAEGFMLAVLCVGASSIFTLAAVPIAVLKDVFCSSIARIALGFWALALLSVFLSEISFVSFIYFCFFSVFPLSFFISVVQSNYKIIGWGGVVVYTFLAISCLIQYFFVPEMLLYGFVSWPLANPNSLAGLLSLGFFASVGWMLGAPDRRQSNIALVLSALLIAAIFTTGSRGALLSLIIMLIPFLFLLKAHAKKHKRCLSALVGISIGAFVLTSVLGYGFSPTDMVVRSVEGTQPLLWSRPDIWVSTWQIIQEHFWTGTGIGTFFLYYPEVRSAGDPSTAGLMAHSDPLQFWAEMGITAPLLFYGFVFAAVVKTRSALKNIAADDVKRIYVLVPFFALAALVIHAHVSFHFHVLSILMVAGVMLGFWLSQVSKIDAIQDSILHEKAFLRFGLALPLVVGMAVFAQSQASEILTSRGHSALMQGQMDSYAGQVNRAGQLSSDRNARSLVAAASVPLGIAQFNGPLMEKTELQAVYEQTKDLLDRAEAANPRLVQIPYSRAQLVSYVGVFLDLPDEKASQEYLQEALGLDPLHLGSRVFLAKLLMRKKQKREALDVLKAGLDWKYKNQNPRYYLELTMNLAKELGDDEMYQKAQQNFELYFPSDEVSGL